MKKKIRLLNTKFLKNYIIYCDTNEHTKIIEKIILMSELKHTFAPCHVNAIIEEAKTTQLEIL